MRTNVLSRPVLAGGLFAVALFAAPAPGNSADDVAAFYAGKQVRVVIGQVPGGGIDLLIRTVIRHMGRHVPGNPAFVPQNMPGAGSRVAANWLYNVAPRDGTVIGNVTQNTPIDQAMKEDGVQFDVAKFNWIGNPQAINNIILSWRPSGLATMADVKAKGGLICGGTAASSPSVLLPQMLKNLTGSDIRIISGYPGSQETGLAMERGELNCLGASTLPSARAMFGPGLKDQRMAILLQWGVEKDPNLSAFEGREVPLITEFAQNELDRRVLDFINVNIPFGRPLLLPPEVPEERVSALRRAFEATMGDPEFLADAEKQKFDILPVAGAVLQKLAAEVVKTPAEVIGRSKELTTLRDVVELKK